MDEWIPSVGLPRWKAKAEVPQGSLQTKELMPAMLLLQLNEICKRKSLGDVLFNFLLKRVAPIDEKRQVVLDKSNSAVLTAFFLKYLLTSQEVSISGQKSTQIISGLLTSISQSSSAINLQELRYLVEIGELLGAKEIYFPEIEEQKIKENSNVTLFYKTIKIKWSFQDLYGQRVSNSKKVIVRIGTWESEASETYILHKVTERSPTVQIEQEIGSQWKFVYSARLFVLVEPALKDFTLTLFKGADKVKD